MAELFEMPFELRTQVCSTNHVLDDDPDLPMGRGNFFLGGGRGGPLYDIGTHCGELCRNG